jgi:hypothetical protein
MPITKVLPDEANESSDVPKKFQNIDTEPFVFNWNGVPFGGALPDRVSKKEKEVETIDIDGLGNRIVSKTVVASYDVKRGILPNEIVTLPKYLVNFAAMHLARKISKREAIESYVPENLARKQHEVSHAMIGIHNEEREKELQKLIVGCNFGRPFVGVKQDEKTFNGIGYKEDGEQEDTSPNASSVDDDLICEICGFVAKNPTGLIVHKKLKHRI